MRGVRVALLGLAVVAATDARAEGLRKADPGLCVNMRAQHDKVRQTVYPSRPRSDTPKFLGQAFDRRVRLLRRGDHWVEVGPGEESMRVRAYLEEDPRPGVRITTIGLEPWGAKHERLRDDCASRGIEYQHITGFIESCASGSILPANVVSDQYSAIAYTHDVTGMVEVEANLNMPGGVLHSHFTGPAPGRAESLPPEILEMMPWTRIVDRHGQDATAAWLDAARGAKLVDYEAAVLNSGDMVHRFGLRRMSTDPVRMARLVPQVYEEGDPPYRVMLWDGRDPGTHIASSPLCPIRPSKR